MIERGIPIKLAISIGMSSKGYYHLAKTKAMQMGLTKRLVNRPLRIRMRSGVGKVREKLALTRFSHFIWIPIEAQKITEPSIP